jgi:hypothetical protein
VSSSSEYEVGVLDAPELNPIGSMPASHSGHPTQPGDVGESADPAAGEDSRK